MKVAIEFGEQTHSVFEANLEGAKQVAARYGLCEPTYGGPISPGDGMTSSQIAQQAADIKADVAMGDKVIATSANVPASALEAAMKAGVKVITFDSDTPGARDLFIQGTSYQAVARALIDAVTSAVGPHAQLGIVDTSPDAVFSLAVAGAMQSYAKASYPGITWTGIGYGPSWPALGVSEGLIHSYPHMKALLALAPGDATGAAQAVSDLHEVGKIAVFGIGDPEPNARYFTNGSLRALFGWNYTDEGKFLMCVAKLAYGNAIRAGSSFRCPNGPQGSWIVATKPNATSGATRDAIVFSSPLEFTPQNRTQYDF